MRWRQLGVALVLPLVLAECQGAAGREGAGAATGAASAPAASAPAAGPPAAAAPPATIHALVKPGASRPSRIPAVAFAGPDRGYLAQGTAL